MLERVPPARSAAALLPALGDEVGTVSKPAARTNTSWPTRAEELWISANSGWLPGSDNTP